MYIFILIIHIIASIFLIGVILLQAGRGGGLSEAFGSSQIQSLFGTKSTNVLTRLTTVCAIVFIVTCLTLAIISTHRSKSLVGKVKMPSAVETDEVEGSNNGGERELPVEPTE